MKLKAIQFAFALLAFATVPMYAFTSSMPFNQVPRQLEAVGIEEHLGRQIDLNLTFTAENGYPVALKDLFHKGRPVILTMVYYTCPQLCNLVLNGLTKSLREIPWTPGNEFDVITVSINPEEGFDLAQRKKAVYLATYDKPAPGWHFLADRDGNAKRLAELAGFKYRYDERQQQYAHAAAIMVLTPDGKMARYLYGAAFPSRNLRFALAEASEGRSTMALEKILLYCYHYDPKSGAYVLFATNVMRGGGLLTVLVMGYFLRRLFRDERRAAAALKEGLA